ncbi:hypothetical protein MBLNU457_g0276t1 [Dothideomycetes sp. NU457]
MPALVRKLLICAGAQGVLLQPVNQRNQPSTSPALVVDYKSHSVSPSLRDSKDDDSSEQLEAHGIVGLLDLGSTSYLISISQREQVAQIREKPVYTITGVTLIPLSSRSEAANAISQANKTLKHGKSTDAEETDDEDDNHSVTQTDEEHDVPGSPADPPATLDVQKGLSQLKQGTSVVADVIKDKGKYGRFAERWFSKGGWQASANRQPSMSPEDDLTREQKRQGIDALPDDSKPEEAPASTDAEKAAEVNDESEEASAEELAKPPSSPSQGVLKSLTPRILRTAKLYFASRSFFFSYDHDISHSVLKQDSHSSPMPLFKRFDPLFFWNQNLIRPFIDAGQHGFVLPLIQGFVGQRAFTIGKTASEEKDKILESTANAGEVIEMQERKQAAPESSEKEQSADDKASSSTEGESHDFLLTLISRRSVKRAGLRYLRRGVDDQGSVANSVETEQILSSQTWDPASKIFSLVQIRGSIPVFFSQSPYSFKPVVVTYGSEATNQTAFAKHFQAVIDRYGDVQVASLIDKHGTEVSVGELYEHHAKLLNGETEGENNSGAQKIGFEWFDFHHECKGMKFENVSLLTDKLGPQLDRFGWTETENSKVVASQSGVLRTNCMDCLDRTNVTQSAVAGQIIQKQLQQLGLSIDLHSDPKTSWFNTLWADNGDAISKQYAGTAALKGDFTRTRKRTWPGALTDFSLTLNRYYNNIFGDYFLQTCIDYMLGNAGVSIFEEFETDMMTQDYALDMRKVRQTAIETCVKIVLGSSPSGGPEEKTSEEEHKDEDLVSGWTLGTPAQPNTLRGTTIEECVVLLTEQALYAVRFDWNTEKVGSYERIPLADIKGLQRGVYITSSLGPSHLDESKNVGFVVKYEVDENRVIRTNTRSLGNEVTDKGDPFTGNDEGGYGYEGKEGKEDEAKKDEGVAAKDMAAKPKASDQSTPETRILAFKALPPRATAAKTGRDDGITDLDEKATVEHVTDDIYRLCRTVTAAETSSVPKKSAENEEANTSGNEIWAMEEKDVISSTEAKRSTGYLESIGYSLKKLVWS